MKAEGKLRAVGITEGFLADPGHAMLKAALSDDWFDTIMAGFNFSNASAAESVFPAARKADVGVIGMFAMRGLIGRRGAGDAEPGVPFESIDRLLEETGTKSLTELAYRYCRHQPGMDVVMTGTGDPEHLRENIAAALLPPLPSEVLDRLRMFSPARPV